MTLFQNSNTRIIKKLIIYRLMTTNISAAHWETIMLIRSPLGSFTLATSNIFKTRFRGKLNIIVEFSYGKRGGRGWGDWLHGKSLPLLD